MSADRALDPSNPLLACRRRAMDLLARRDHSRLELTRKLTARDFEPDVIADALDALESDGLLREQRFVESFITGRIRKGQGPVRIRAELTQRGIDDGDITEGLMAIAFDWRGLAAEVRAKRFGEAPPADFKARARQAKFLQYRGFEPEQIRAALDMAGDWD
jgi:regulatory protein